MKFETVTAPCEVCWYRGDYLLHACTRVTFGRVVIDLCSEHGGDVARAVAVECYTPEDQRDRLCDSCTTRGPSVQLRRANQKKHDLCAAKCARSFAWFLIKTEDRPAQGDALEWDPDYRVPPWQDFSERALQRQQERRRR